MVDKIIWKSDNQKKFFERTQKFIQENDKVLINQGGMGLGKTLATILAMNLSKNNYIATPFKQIKNEWSEELNRVELPHGVWFSKSDCCIEKMENIKFNITKNCNDGCIYRKHLEQNKDFTHECSILSKSLSFPLNIEKYYEKNGCKNCLLPITRNRLSEEEIMIGDYFGIFIPKMFNYVTKKNQYETDLHIDEGHMLIERAKQFLSRQLSIGKMIASIKKAMNEDNYFYENLNERLIIESFIDEFINLKDNLILILKNDKYKIRRTDYETFIKYWNKINKLNFNDFLSTLKRYTETKYTPDDEEEGLPKIFLETLSFFEYWYEHDVNEKYTGFFEYFTKNEGDILLKINCSDTSEFLSKNLTKFNKIHIMSGTIPNKEYFTKMIGISNCIFELPLSSYSVKDNIINYGVDDFTTTLKGGINPREVTYQKNIELLKSVLNKLKGRILIYTQSKEYATKLFTMLNGMNVFNLNQETDDALSKIKEEFNNSVNGIAVGYITGKVEGQNYMDDDGNAVENVLIYGYPYLQRGIEYEDFIKYWGTLLKGDMKKARAYVEFYPTSSKIYQAVMRAKRNNNDNPVIILWGKEFAKDNYLHEYFYPELRGDYITNVSELFSKIEKIQSWKK